MTNSKHSQPERDSKSHSSANPPDESVPEKSPDKSATDAPIAPSTSPGPSPALAAAPAAIKRSMPLALSIMLGLLLAACCAWFFYKLTWFILLLYLSFVLATIVEAPVARLTRKGIPRTLATVIILFGGLALIAGVGFLLVSSVNHQVAALGDDMKKIPDRVTAFVDGIKHRFPGIGEQLGKFDFSSTVKGMLPTMSSTWTGVLTTFEMLTYVVVTFFTVMYMVIEGPGHLKGARRLLQKSSRLEATTFFTNLAKTHRAWFLASTGNVASAATLTSVGLWLCGIPGALVLGVLAGFGELIPNVGPILFALPSILLTLIIKPDMLPWVIAMFAIVQTIQSYTISPFLMKVGVELPVLVTIIAVLVMGTLFGFLGVLVAIPLTADMVAAWNYLNAQLEKDSIDYDSTNEKPTETREPATTSSPAPTAALPTSKRRLFRKPGKVTT